MSEVRLNVGCGAHELWDGWVNVDVVAYTAAVVVCDVRDLAALGEVCDVDSVDVLRCSHLLEHFDGHEQLRVMENLWRVAKPGAMFECIVPYGQSRHFWRDPDHVRPMFRDSWAAFCQPYYERCDLGYRGDWQVRDVSLLPEADEMVRARAAPKAWLHDRAYKLWDCVVEMSALLECVKPRRERLDRLAEDYTVRIDYGT